MAKTNPLVSWHLTRFCKQHEIDVHEIDNTLTYGENKEHLEGFTIKSLEELAEKYGRTVIEEPKTETRKKWVLREPKQKWITISKTHIEISSS